MTFNPVLVVTKGTRPDWYPLTAPYARSQHVRSYWQLANTLIPYLLLLALFRTALGSESSPDEKSHGVLFDNIHDAIELRSAAL